jgi:DNA-binding MarR family transcriptional regulator
MTEKKPSTTNEPGRFAYEGLDSVFLSKARLGILTSLLVHPEGLLFGELKELCSLTDGNLSRHLQHLQEHEPPLIEVWKRFKDNRPQTLVRITSAGQARFREYLAALEAVIADAETAAEPAPRRRGRLADGAAPA